MTHASDIASTSRGNLQHSQCHSVFSVEAPAPLRVDELHAIGPYGLSPESRFRTTPGATCDTRAPAATPRLEELSARIAAHDLTTLLTGESGTGKTTLARFIHRHSVRADKPFVAVNCASLPRDLIEAELFGHQKGAFTGAVQDRRGRFEIADGGTLLLDEIGDLPLELQPKLLTFLQDQSFQRIGGERSLRVDVRIIAATNRDLCDLCRNDQFREDLYYRLSVLKLEVPPLRERLDMIDGLADAVLHNIAVKSGQAPMSLDASARELLKRHSWPGNIRELENVLARSTVFGTGTVITAEDLQFDHFSLHTECKSVADADRTASRMSLAGSTLADIEKQAILDTLEACGGNKAQAARTLGVSERTIYNKLQRFGIRPVP